MFLTNHFLDCRAKNIFGKLKTLKFHSENNTNLLEIKSLTLIPAIAD